MYKATKKYTMHLRFWHWINVIVISGSLFTVFLNSTLLDKKANAKFISEQLEPAGASLTAQQAKVVAHGLEDKVWDWHVYVGYALIALLVYRLIAEFSQNSSQKLSQKIKKAFLLYRVQKDKSSAKELLVKFSYVFFYAMLAFMAISGLSIKFHEQLSISDTVAHSVKEMHELVMYLILSFIVIHIVGVVIAEKSNQPGIVSDMINGGNADN